GLNAVIRAVGRRSFSNGHEVLGIRAGWKGLVEGLIEPLGPREISGILPRGGTIIGTSRTNPFKTDSVDRVLQNFSEASLDALVAIGGEDTLGVAARLHREHDFPVVGVPKTIDNDLGATDYTFGFDTAVNIAMEAIDRLHTTADSHHRVLVVEVMGRHAGWIAFHAGLAGGANLILIPERPFDLERVCELVGRRYEAQFAPILVVAEGAQPQGGIPAELDAGKDAFGHARLGGIAHWLEGEIEGRTGKETRATVLGHVQRGGTPTAFDRVLATRFGLHAIDAADAGAWGQMTALRGTDISLVPLSEATAELKTVPEDLYAEAEVFFG
ncbi:MAG TPA: ATP-dependent 6-phosphofructokinase, partial [Solirubrobacterales bacterium]|nr:ATP-dependent 6-phosphofructokinase [Solirubrobacterales bacterium]